MKAISNHRRGCALACAALWASATAHAQPCHPGWVEGYVNGPTLSSEVRAIAYFEHNGVSSLYAAGHFDYWGTAPVSGVARWDGSDWVPVGGGIAPSYGGGFWLGVLDDGGGRDLYLTGDFTTTGGIVANNIARWDGNDWSALGTGTNGTVRMATAYDDGTGPALYAVGLFTQAGGVPARGIAKWDGTTWSALGEGLLGGPGYGYSVNVHDLGEGPKLYVGGYFSLPTPGGNASNFAAWDGTSWSSLGGGVYGNDPLVMNSIVFDHGPGPQLTISGRFGVTPTQPQQARVARWDGSQWLQVGVPLGLAHEYVNSMAIERGEGSAQTLYVGGLFASASWLNNIQYVARLSGGDWVGVEGGMEGLSGGYVRCLIERPLGALSRIVASGAFQQAGNAIASRVAEWDGEHWRSLETHRGLTGPAYIMALHDDGAGERLFVGGWFEAAAGIVANNVAAWDGARWHTLQDGMSSVSGSSGVIDLAVSGVGGTDDLYAAGEFDVAGHGPAPNIARWDGHQWSSLGGTGPSGPAYAMCEFDSGDGVELIVGGAFNKVGPQVVRGTARWDGTQWRPMGNGLLTNSSWSVSALAPFDEDDGKSLYAGGYFLGVGYSIARWDGENWNHAGGFLTGPLAGRVLDLHVWRGDLYVAGEFDNILGGLEARNFAVRRDRRWVPIGMGTHEVNGPISSIATVDLPGTSMLCVAGDFMLTGPSGATHSMAGWLGRWSPLVPGLGPGGTAARVVTWNRKGKASLFVAGNFATAGGVPADNFAQWRFCACGADCDGNAALTIADLACFQARFAAGDPYADCNADRVLSLADFGCFQTRFTLGCP